MIGTNLFKSILLFGARKALEKAGPFLPIRFRKAGGVVMMSPQLVERAARRAARSMKDASLVEMTFHDDHYGFLLSGPKNTRVLIRMIPEWMRIDGDTFKLRLKLFGGQKSGMEFQHDSAPISFSIRMMDHLFGTARKRIGNMEGVEISEDALTITRNLGDSGLMATLRDRIIGEGFFHLPLSLEENWLALHFGAILEESSDIPLLDLFSQWFSQDDDGPDKPVSKKNHHNS
ncbi:MAG: hypothetical protein HQL76_10125 [Magnetococcales bacterium]|nr:hypothetical protein [Magnetococcales bacterium]